MKKEEKPEMMATKRDSVLFNGCNASESQVSHASPLEPREESREGQRSEKKA